MLVLSMKTRFTPDELVPRCKHLISECKRAAEHYAYQAELREYYGRVNASYRDKESLALIRRKRHRQKVNLKAALRAQQILNKR